MSKRPDSHRQRLYIGLFILAAYAGLAIVATWPLAIELSAQLPGNSDDTLLHYWNGWWVQQALRKGWSPYFTSYLFYPDGVSLVTHNMAWFHILPWLALEPLFGGVAAYNLSLLLTLTLCGCAAFLLVAKLTADCRAAFLGGLIYLAWPYRLSQLDHPNLIATQWIPLFLLFLVYTIQTGKWKYGLLTGVFFALVGYTRWQLLIPAAIMGLVYFAFAAPGWFPPARRYVLARLVLAGGVALLALLPPLLLLLNQPQEGDGHLPDVLREGEEALMQTDLLAYVTPAASHFVLGEQTEPLYDRYYRDRVEHRRFPAYIGFTVLSLAFAGIWFKLKFSLPWLVMGLILISLALGSVLRFNGQLHVETPTLYGLLSPAAAAVRLMRVPDRFNMFLALPVSVLAAYGVTGLLAREGWQVRWRAALVSGLLAAVILFEYLAVPVPLDDFPFPPFYGQLANEPGDFAVLNLPIDPLRAKVYMFHQTSHQRPILQGNLSRFPDGVYAYIDNNPWLRVLRQADEMSPQLPDISRQLATLARDGVRYLIVHKTLVGADRVAHWQRDLLIEPRYEDRRIAVYTTEPEAGRDFGLVQELAPGLGPIDTLVSAVCLNPDRFLEVDIGWGSNRPLAQDYEVALSLVDESGQAQQRQRFPLSTWPTSQWPAHAVVWGYYPLRLSPSIPPGDYTVRLTLLQGENEQTQSEPMTVEAIKVQVAPCDFAIPPQANEVNVLFGDRLHLLAYQMERQGESVTFTLYWRSERRMDTDYKIFVHIFDPATDVPVAQDDARPRREAYPTAFWGPGEVLDDRIPVSLQGVPEGSYGVAIGVYEPVTGERLTAVDAQGRILADGRLVLAETIEVR